MAQPFHMNISISHNREQETAKGKAIWFQSLSLTERMDYLCSITELIFENNRKVGNKKNAQLASGRVRVTNVIR